MELYDRLVDPELLIRRVTIAAENLIAENAVPEEEPEQLDLFTDYEELERQREHEEIVEKKERSVQKATLKLQQKYGKNAVLKGMNLLEGGTTILRNGQIGGHRAGTSSLSSSTTSSTTGSGSAGFGFSAGSSSGIFSSTSCTGSSSFWLHPATRPAASIITRTVVIILRYFFNVLSS